MKTLAILAGGQGLRLGGVRKELLRVEGRSVLARLSALRSCVDDALLITRAETGMREGLRCVPDVVPGRGAPGGLLTALTHAKDGSVLLLGCDMPFVTAAVVQALFAALEQGRTPTGAPLEAVCVRSGAGLEPLLAVYSTTLRERARALVDAGGSLRSLLETSAVGILPLHEVDPSGQAVVGLNTPADLRRYGASLPEPREVGEHAGEESD